MFDLSGRIALVTGSNRGIGRALLLGLAAQGADVYVHCRQACDSADETAAGARRLGVRAACIHADLADGDAHLQLQAQMELALGMPDLLVLNASFQIRKKWMEVEDGDFDAQMRVDCLSSLRLIQTCVPAMEQKGFGRIVTIGSVQQRRPHPEMLVYAAAKVAQVSMVHSLALQLAPCGITVNNVAPGTIYTDRNTEALADAAYHEKVRRDTPMGYIGTPEDCVAPVVMLCAGEARYITGADLLVDGGKHL